MPKDIKPVLVIFGIGMASAYAFAVLSVKYGPFPGIARKV